MEKAIIYLRVSTREQNEQIQKDDCIAYCNNHNWEIEGIYQERVSGFKKDVLRPERDKVIEKARLGEAKHIIVWAFDRWVRNRDTLIEDVTTLINYGCKLHSIKDDWYESINIEGSLGKTIREFMLGLIGSLAQMESERRSERILLGKKNTTIKQGRKKTERDYALINRLHEQGLSTYKIAEEYNKVHRPHISHMAVYTYLKSKSL